MAIRFAYEDGTTFKSSYFRYLRCCASQNGANCTKRKCFNHQNVTQSARDWKNSQTRAMDGGGACLARHAV